MNILNVSIIFYSNRNSVFLVFFIVGIDYLFYQLPKDVEICDLMPNYMHVCCCKIIMRAEKIINVINSRPWTIYGIYQYTNNNVSIHRQPITMWKVLDPLFFVLSNISIKMSQMSYLIKMIHHEMPLHKFLLSNSRNNCVKIAIKVFWYKWYKHINLSVNPNFIEM